MPQTREHLDICGLLGITRGVIVLSKVDLVDDAWLDLVTADVRAAVEKSFLEDATIIPVSTLTGAGLDTLRAELVRLAAQVPARARRTACFGSLDRVFTMKGFGTVVTGTILAGRVRVGDDVVALPDGASGKVRGLHVHGEPVEAARAGMRCAIHLAGVEGHDVARGLLLAHPGEIEPAHLIDARLRYLPTCRTALGGARACSSITRPRRSRADRARGSRYPLAPRKKRWCSCVERTAGGVVGAIALVRGFVPQANRHHAGRR